SCAALVRHHLGCCHPFVGGTIPRTGGQRSYVASVDEHRLQPAPDPVHLIWNVCHLRLYRGFGRRSTTRHCPASRYRCLMLLGYAVPLDDVDSTALPETLIISFTAATSTIATGHI